MASSTKPRWRRFAGGIVVGLLWTVGIAIGAVLWHTPLGTGYAAAGDAKVAACAAAMAAHGKPPMDYVVDQFARRDVVIVGESHRVAQDAEFVAALIPAVYAAGVRHLVIEFGRQPEQATVDALVAGEKFDRVAAKRVLGDFGYLWLYEEYLGLFEAAWRLNASLAEGVPRFAIVLGTPAVGSRASKDGTMAELALERVRAGDKVLVYCGMHHGFTRYRQPLPFEALYLDADRPGRMGNRLHAALGERVACIRLHAPVAKRWAFFAWLLYRRPLLLPFRGVLDRAYALHGRPVGFDTALEPFAALPDDDSYYALHRGTLLLADFVDGYVVLAPLAERRAVRPFVDLGQPDELAFLRQRYAGTVWADSCRDAEALRQTVVSNGLFPERSWASTDRSGYDEASWLPAMRAFWPFLLGWGLVWWWWWQRQGCRHGGKRVP